MRRLLIAAELAELLNVHESWVYEQTRLRASDPIPHHKMGKYVRFDLDDPALIEWIGRRRKNSKQRNGNEPKRKESA